MQKFAGLLLVVAFPSIAYSDFPSPTLREVTTPYPPVQVTRFEFEKPRPIRAWAIRIDATNPNVEFVVTPRCKTEPGFQTRCATTMAFAQAEGLQLAINGSPFTPLREKAGEPMNIEGLQLSRGELISPPQKEPWYGAFLVLPDNRPAIRQYPIADSNLQYARHGIGGYEIAVTAGKNRYVDGNPPSVPPHPRTAVGFSEGGKYAWWLIVDGRQTGRSEGMFPDELGNFALSLGISDLLNLDGGGSTTFVLQDPKSGNHQLINTPVGQGVAGTLRLTGNNIGVRFYSGPRDLTAEQLCAIMPNLRGDRVPLFLGALNRAMNRFHIDNPKRRAAFLAQLAHESGELRHMEELADGSAYEGRADLGNTQPGDGTRYKGRGPIQLTGRANYRAAGLALDMNLEEEPKKAADAEIGCLIAGWFWETHRLNELADAGNFVDITRRINGGLNGQKEREKYWERAKQVLK